MRTLATSRTRRGTRQPRQPAGTSAGGQYAPAPVADQPGAAEGLSLNGGEADADINHATATYQHLWGEIDTSARARGNRVHFHTDEKGHWTSTASDEEIAQYFGFNMRASEPDYWVRYKENNYVEDKDGLTVWCGDICRDMLEAGEASPFEENEGPGAIQNVQAALTAAYTPYYRRTGRHLLTAAMARTRGGDKLLQENPDAAHKLGGFWLGKGSRAQATANALAAVHACSEPNPEYGKFVEHQPWRLCERPIFEVPISEGGGFDPRPNEHGDINGTYHGEDGDLLLKVLKAPAGHVECRHIGGVVQEPITGADELRRVLDGDSPLAEPDHPCHDEAHASRREGGLKGWAQTALWASLRDPAIREAMTSTRRAGYRQQRAPGGVWHNAVADCLANAPDDSPSTIWRDEAQWRQGMDILLDSIRPALETNTFPNLHFSVYKHLAGMSDNVSRYATSKQRRDYMAVMTDDDGRLRYGRLHGET